MMQTKASLHSVFEIQFEKREITRLQLATALFFLLHSLGTQARSQAFLLGNIGRRRVIFLAVHLRVFGFAL
jgi:hypothetical protein